MPDGTSPTSFPIADAATARPFFDEAVAIVGKQAETRARHPVTGVCWSGMTTPAPKVEDVETVRLRLVAQDAERAAYLASPAGKARSVIAKACRVCELNQLRAPYSALMAVGAALSRGDGTALRMVEAAFDAICALPDDDVRIALQLLATELRVYVAEVA